MTRNDILDITRKGGSERRNGVMIFRRFLICTASNGTGAPFADDAWTIARSDDGAERRFRGKAISLTRKRNEYGERILGPAIFIGRRHWIRKSS